jgi:hypothetical protein
MKERYITSIRALKRGISNLVMQMRIGYHRRTSTMKDQVHMFTFQQSKKNGKARASSESAAPLSQKKYANIDIEENPKLNEKSSIRFQKTFF